MEGELKDVLTSIRGTVESFKTQQDAMQKQIDAIDARGQYQHRADIEATPFVDRLKSSDQFQRLVHDRRGRAILTLSGKDAESFLQTKTTLTATGQGFVSPGVMPSERIPGITPEARQQLFVRDALTARPTTNALVDFVRVTTPNTIASPVAEASTKPENAVSFEAASEKVKTIATWQPASRQILDDLQELASFLETSLTYYVDLAEELELLSGDGTGEHLHGLIPQAQAFDDGLLVPAAGYNRMDIVGRVIQQITVAKEIPPTFVVLHPNDWWSIRLTKDSLGRYILGDPQTSVRARLWDCMVIPTTNISAGTFLVGPGDATAAEIRDRMEVQFEVSTEHADFFTKNLVACRAEKRVALVVKRPGSFVTGTFTTSPAS